MISYFTATTDADGKPIIDKPLTTEQWQALPVGSEYYVNIEMFGSKIQILRKKA